MKKKQMGVMAPRSIGGGIWEIEKGLGEVFYYSYWINEGCFE